MIKNFFGRINRWLRNYWKDILSWIMVIVSYLAVFAFGFLLFLIVVKDEVVYMESMIESPEPEVCALCRNKEGKKIHAPCIINLSTGEIAELSVYQPHPSEIGEVSAELKKGYFSFSSGAGANIMQNPENEFCEATLPKDEKIIIITKQKENILLIRLFLLSGKEYIVFWLFLHGIYCPQV